jgi:precorrin-3B synthase
LRNRPSRGEIGSFNASRRSEAWRKALRQPISPLEGEMSGRTEGGAVEA